MKIAPLLEIVAIVSGIYLLTYVPWASISWKAIGIGYLTYFVPLATLTLDSFYYYSFRTENLRTDHCDLLVPGTLFLAAANLFALAPLVCPVHTLSGIVAGGVVAHVFLGVAILFLIGFFSCKEHFHEHS